MHPETPLISTIVGGFVLAFILGLLAQRIKISPLVGYLAAGIIVGPFTPGYVADLSLAPELAEIGIILLMFGVGLHFSIKDLLSVKHIAIPGALIQIIAATLMGLAVSYAMGWPLLTGILFGLALSTASTVVLLREMESRELLETQRGKIAIGWLIVEDLVMVVALVLLPAIANINASEETQFAEIAFSLFITIAKVIGFIAVMLIIGSRLIPWVLIKTAKTDSQELFTLAVLAIALGVALGAVKLFDVSFALGAFFAGVILNGSELSHRAANDTLPLRDAFAVLFFVSVGMLFDPLILLQHPLAVLATLLIIILGKSIVAFALVRFLGHSKETALTISVSLAQIGEFAFILAGLGLALNIADRTLQSLVLAGAILSIMLNPFLFNLADKFLHKRKKTTSATTKIDTELPQNPIEISAQAIQQHAVTLEKHAIIIGYDVIGKSLVDELKANQIELVVVDESRSKMRDLKTQGINALFGDGIENDLLVTANITAANWLFITISNPYEAAEIAKRARLHSSVVHITAYAEHDDEAEYMREAGIDYVIFPHEEIAKTMRDVTHIFA